MDNDNRFIELIQKELFLHFYVKPSIQFKDFYNNFYNLIKQIYSEKHANKLMKYCILLTVKTFNNHVKEKFSMEKVDLIHRFLLALKLLIAVAIHGYKNKLDKDTFLNAYSSCKFSMLNIYNGKHDEKKRKMINFLYDSLVDERFIQCVFSDNQKDSHLIKSVFEDLKRIEEKFLSLNPSEFDDYLEDISDQEEYDSDNDNSEKLKIESVYHKLAKRLLETFKNYDFRLNE